MRGPPAKGSEAERVRRVSGLLLWRPSNLIAFGAFARAAACTTLGCCNPVSCYRSDYQHKHNGAYPLRAGGARTPRSP